MLASTSPRRRKLLSEAGIAHDIVSPGLDDSHLGIGCGPPRQWACALAYLKAAAGYRAIASQNADLRGVHVLGADTVVIMGDRLFGKARDATEARGMIEAMEDAWHEVVTGVALLEPLRQRRIVWFDSARVWVGRIGRGRIDEYATSGRWAGKAGAYNLEEQVAAGWPIRWEGDPGTVMGLPMQRLVPMLRRVMAWEA